MPTTKLKINLADFSLEVEGKDTFVQTIYQDYKAKIIPGNFEAIATKKPFQTESKGDNARSVHRAKNSKRLKSSARKRKESYQIVKDLDLSAKGKTENALKFFYENKSPSTGMARNAVFVYYLAKISKVNDISLDHIYTCYKDVNEKVPAALHQSLSDTSFRKGWIETHSMEDITITVQGENFVEHDLPQKPHNEKIKK